jgi:hypothetical protein
MTLPTLLSKLSLGWFLIRDTKLFSGTSDAEASAVQVMNEKSYSSSFHSPGEYLTEKWRALLAMQKMTMTSSEKSV